MKTAPSTIATWRTIRADWQSIIARAGQRAGRALPMFGARLPRFNQPLLGASAKTEASARASGVLTGIVYLSPSIESGRNTCAFSCTGCALACLGHNSGRLAFTTSRNSRLWKSALYFGARKLFDRLIIREALNLEKRARARDMIGALRVDGSSDTGAGARLARFLPSIQCYDYTKNYQRALAAARGEYGPNYRACFSWSGETRNAERARRILRAGGNVAVVFDSLINRFHKAPLPKRFLGARVVDGDLSDARFLDPPGTVIGLRFKAARERAARLEDAGTFIVHSAELTPAGYFREAV